MLCRRLHEKLSLNFLLIFFNVSALCFTPWTTKFVCNQKREERCHCSIEFFRIFVFFHLIFQVILCPLRLFFPFLNSFLFLLHEHYTTFPLNRHRWHNQMMLRYLTFWEAQFSNRSPMVPIFSEYPLLLFSIFDYFLVEIQHCWTFRTLVEHAGCLKVVPPIRAATWLIIPPKVAKNEDTHYGEDKHTNIEHMNEIRAI